MIRGAKFFDQGYFETDPSKSNYPKVGGYRKFADSINWRDVAGHILDVTGVDPDGARILDIGCAYGHLVAELRRMGAKAFGVDISEYAIQNAVPGALEFVEVVDITRHIPRPSSRGKWDLVITLDVLEHCDSLREAAEIVGRLASVSRRQYHKVNTGQYPYQAWGGDLSHGVLATLEEWQAIIPEGAVVFFEET